MLRPEPAEYGVAPAHAVHEDAGVRRTGPVFNVHDDHELDEKELVLAFHEAELRLLATTAEDRAQMHSNLAQQRDNWNKLFQATLTTGTVAAAVMAGLNGGLMNINVAAAAGQCNSLSLSVPAMLLNLGCALVSGVVNQFQPSQLAEEQRTATRLFTKLASDIHYALHLPLRFRQHTLSLLRDSQARLHALDRAFPMPLTPGGLEKFPKHVRPPVLADAADHHDVQCVLNGQEQMGNGWSPKLVRELTDASALLCSSDVATYTCWAQNVVKVNRAFAIAAPLLSLAASACNALLTLGFVDVNANAMLAMGAAVLSVLAVFAGSFSHDMQLGMVMELYRNSAGYYAEVDASIRKALSVPVWQRENGQLFRQRVAYHLGRAPRAAAEDPLVPTTSKTAGTLF